MLYIFTLIGVKNKTFLEIGTSFLKGCNFPQNNTLNLALHHGWNGIWVDHDTKSINSLKKYLDSSLDSKYFVINRDKLRYAHIAFCHHVTCENINKFLIDNEFHGEIDLLSIDIDGNDYWIWSSIHTLNPRVVIIEFNNQLDFYSTIVVTYKKDFKRYDKINYGCSLGALVKVANQKGYRLIGVSSSGFNALFMRNDIETEVFKTMGISDCCSIPIFAFLNQTERLKKEEVADFVEV